MELFSSLLLMSNQLMSEIISVMHLMELASLLLRLRSEVRYSVDTDVRMIYYVIQPAMQSYLVVVISPAVHL